MSEASAVMKYYGAVLVEKERAPFYHRTTERLAKITGIMKPSLHILPPDNPNALAFGRSPDDTAIAVSSALFCKLDENELESIIAHEIAHIAKGHTLKKSEVAMKALGIALTGEIAGRAIMTSDADFTPWDNDNDDILSFILKIGVGLLATGVGAAIGTKWLTDENFRCEYEADNTGAEISKKSWALVRALSKLENMMKQFTVRYKPEVAQLFIISPSYLEGQSHPHTSDRICKLSQLSNQSKSPIPDLPTIFCSTCGDKTDSDGKYCSWCGNLINL